MLTRWGRKVAGFTLVEVVVAIFILGVGLASVLSLMSHILPLHGQSADATVALSLAQQLLAEMDTQPFEDPDETAAFGLEPGELPGDGTRAAFDDVDDYSGWAATPPVDRAGLAIPGAAGLARQVAVHNVNEWLPDGEMSNGTTGAKRITVTVIRDGRVLATLTTLRMRGGNEEDYQ